MMGPNNERTELCFFSCNGRNRLQNVHPTWAGAFVLAALGAAFPGIHFLLLDSDCLPVTLFEVEDLWHESYLARYPLRKEVRSVERYKNDLQVKDSAWSFSSKDGTGSTLRD